MNLSELNKRFGITDQLDFVEGKGELTIAVIKNKFASAVVSLYAGQVLSYRPVNTNSDLMFLSEQAYYQTGKAIKGGVPVCWPWFGPDPQGKGRPAHGFARNSEWTVIDSGTASNGATRLALELKLNETTRALWDGEIEARLDIEVGESLKLKLTTTNKGKETIELSQALHTYFNVGNIAKTSVNGLEDKTYIDKVDGSKEKTQSGEVTINAEVDRIYTDVNNRLVINDVELGRKIHIESEGSHSAVVWNPWKKIAAGMADLGDEDYKRMLCVETTNAGPDVVSVAPGGRYSMSAEYSITAT
ncbi:MAG: D-hexose-6-phosphate mutarotase [Gammaproteobacteria bacterium]